MDDFGAWLQHELDERNLTYRKAGQKGGISNSMISKVINGHANPGLDFCEGIARALKIPTQEVMRRAGLLPPLPEDKKGDYQRSIEKLLALDHERLGYAERLLDTLLLEQTQDDKDKRGKMRGTQAGEGSA